MLRSGTTEMVLADERDGLSDAPARTVVAAKRGTIDVLVTSSIADVETEWRELTGGPVESPGQSYDFVRLWVEDRGVAPADQRYVLGRVDGRPVALWPLHRRRVRGGLTLFSWFPGTHVGCYAPIADYNRLTALGSEGRNALWTEMSGQLTGADLVYLRSVPTEISGFGGLFDELGETLPIETLYRSEYASWEECDKLQRTKSRRKHDRQQGDRLSALGEVSFEEIRNGGVTRCAIETMFQQRSARFKAMGIRDTFVREGLIEFYHDSAKADSGIDVRLHVLRLDGAIVAVRYNVVHGDRMFCLISSMSDDPAIQTGSPGKQCLLRVMQRVFDDGIRVFDMGAGFTDEKRHWCNVQTPLRHHYVGLSRRGGMVIAGHQAFQRARAAIKANKQLKSAVRQVQQVFDRMTGFRAAAQQKSD